MIAVVRDLKQDESLTLLNLVLVATSIFMALIAATGALP
jgi:hypothetical protein